MSNQTHRVLELIRRFNNNEKICISQLQNETMWFEKSEKTIRRDLDIIKKVFPDTFHLIRGEQGCYKAVTRSLFENITSAEQLSLLVQTLNIADRSNLFDDLNIDISDRTILEKQIKETKNIYLFKSKPYENRSGDAALFKQLEQAIYYRKEIIIEYRAGVDIVPHTVKPYNIVFMNENFYLACEVDNPNYQFSPFRISKIESVTNTGKTFHQNRDIARFIKDMQTPIARYVPNYREHLVEVVVEVASSRAHYFKAKKYLPSQKIIKEQEDGILILSFVVTQETEVADLIKRWIPHIKVISPESLKEKIKEEIITYITTL